MKILRKTLATITCLAFLSLAGCKKTTEVVNPNPTSTSDTPVAVTSASATTAKIGTEITLTGSGFVAGVTTVKFGTVVATEVTIASSTTLKVKVPAGTFRSKISVNNGTQTSQLPTNFFTSNYMLNGIDINLIYSGEKVFFGKNYPGPTDATFLMVIPGSMPPVFVQQPISMPDKYFTWTEAETACPAGWRLPSKVEYETLAGLPTATTQQGYATLKNGEMAMTVTGYLNTTLGIQIFDRGALGNYWVNSSNTYFQLNATGNGYVQTLTNGSGYKMCLRCVKDL